MTTYEVKQDQIYRDLKEQGYEGTGDGRWSLAESLHKSRIIWNKEPRTDLTHFIYGTEKTKDSKTYCSWESVFIAFNDIEWDQFDRIMARFYAEYRINDIEHALLEIPFQAYKSQSKPQKILSMLLAMGGWESFINFSVKYGWAYTEDNLPNGVSINIPFEEQESDIAFQEKKSHKTTWMAFAVVVIGVIGIYSTVF